MSVVPRDVSEIRSAEGGRGRGGGIIGSFSSDDQSTNSDGNDDGQWRHSAAKAADNLQRILGEIDVSHATNIHKRGINKHGSEKTASNKPPIAAAARRTSQTETKENSSRVRNENDPVDGARCDVTTDENVAPSKSSNAPLEIETRHRSAGDGGGSVRKKKSTTSFVDGPTTPQRQKLASLRRKLLLNRTKNGNAAGSRRRAYVPAKIDDLLRRCEETAAGNKMGSEEVAEDANDASRRTVETQVVYNVGDGEALPAADGSQAKMEKAESGNDRECAGGRDGELSAPGIVVGGVANSSRGAEGNAGKSIVGDSVAKSTVTVALSRTPCGKGGNNEKTTKSATTKKATHEMDAKPERPRSGGNEKANEETATATTVAIDEITETHQPGSRSSRGGESDHHRAATIAILPRGRRGGMETTTGSAIDAYARTRMCGERFRRNADRALRGAASTGFLASSRDPGRGGAVSVGIVIGTSVESGKAEIDAGRTAAAGKGDDEAASKSADQATGQAASKVTGKTPIEKASRETKELESLQTKRDWADTVIDVPQKCESYESEITVCSHMEGGVASGKTERDAGDEATSKVADNEATKTSRSKKGSEKATRMSNEKIDDEADRGAKSENTHAGDTKSVQTNANARAEEEDATIGVEQRRRCESEEMRALRDKIRASRANAEARNAQRAEQLEEIRQCADAKELLNTTPRVEEERAAARPQNEKGEDGARSQKGEKTKKKREETKEARRARRIEEEAQRIAREQMASDKATKARKRAKSKKKEAEVERNRKANEAADAGRKQEELKAVVEAEADAERKRREECEAAAMAKIALDEADERRRKEELEAAIEAERALEEANRIAKEQEVQKKKNEVAQLIGNILNVDQNEKNAHYQVLGVPPSATDTQIKKAYRKLALRLHPDKINRHGHSCTTADAAESFKVATEAYDTLKDAARRGEYDLSQNDIVASWSDEGNGDCPSHSFGTIPAGASVTVHGRRKGTVINFDSQTELYAIDLDDSTLILSGASGLFQNIVVCLRAFTAKELGVFLVTLLWEVHHGAAERWEGGGPSYRVSYCAPGGYGEEATTLRPEQFIVPNGTVVRLAGLGRGVQFEGRYGTVVDWKERSDNWGGDTSYYEVRLSPAVLVHVKMANVCM